MAETGGSIESVTLDGRTFAVAADADSQRKLGGFENEIQANGDGTARQVKTRVPWSITDLAVSIDDAADDAEFIQSLVDGNTFYPVTISYASGEIYQGSGQVSGENATSSQATTMSIGMMGTGTLTRQ